LIESIVSKFDVIMKQAVDQYGVNPAIFLALYLSGVPFFYYSLFRMIRAIAKKLEKEVSVWCTVLLGTIVAPFIYVLFFGRNLPWWAYGIITLLIGQGMFSLIIRKLRKTKDADPLIP